MWLQDHTPLPGRRGKFAAVTVLGGGIFEGEADAFPAVWIGGWNGWLRLGERVEDHAGELLDVIGLWGC